MRLISAVILCLLLFATGCPSGEQDGRGATGRQDLPNADISPAAPIPQDSPYLEYAGLRLGMNAVKLSQVYNAPKGQGDGFTRVIQFFGDVHHHIIDFDAPEGCEQRRIVASLYRDELYVVVDDRDWMTREHRELWWQDLVDSYGDDYEAILPTSQWSWGDKAAVMLTFTQDNASENLMNGNVVLQHTPTWDAAHNYLALWEKEHPAEAAKAGD